MQDQHVIQEVEGINLIISFFGNINFVTHVFDSIMVSALIMVK